MDLRDIFTRRAELAELAKPLVQWLNENFHPHAEIRISCDSVDLYEIQMRHPYDGRFIKD